MGPQLGDTLCVLGHGSPLSRARKRVLSRRSTGWLIGLDSWHADIFGANQNYFQVAVLNANAHAPMAPPGMNALYCEAGIMFVVRGFPSAVIIISR